MTTLTFGKYEGHTLNDLVKTDRDYLIWCTDNLRNRQWVRKIEQVLRRNPEFRPVQELEKALSLIGASSLQIQQLIKAHIDCRLNIEKYVSPKNRQAVKVAFDRYNTHIEAQANENTDTWMKPVGHDAEW